MIKIHVDLNSNCLLKKKEAEYVFENLCLTMGVSWQFVQGGDTKADIYYGVQPDENTTLRIKAACEEITKPEIVKFNNLNFLENKKSSQSEQYKEQNGNCHFNNDIIYTCFYLLTGKDEVNIDRNRWDRHNITQSILHKNNLLHTPIINGYTIFIKELFSQQFDFIPLWPDGKKAALALSHDVDYPEIIRPIELLKYLLTNKFKSSFKTIVNIINGKDHFWQFENFMKLEKKYNARSAFYFCSYKGNVPRFIFKAPDPFYDIKKPKYLKIANQMQKEGFEVGFHSSYLTCTSKERFASELDKLKEIFSLSKVGHRHHYWHTNPEDPSETCAIHEEVGLAYDTSIMFGAHSGFRYSICTPYHVWNRQKDEALNILQLPPTLMDDHLFGYSRFSPFTSFKDHIDSLVSSILNNNGVFVADFHARVLNETFFPQWGEAYEYLLQEIEKTDSFYIDTPMNISAHWNKRESMIRSNSV